jgi:hypothetical protein
MIIILRVGRREVKTKSIIQTRNFSPKNTGNYLTN